MNKEIVERKGTNTLAALAVSDVVGQVKTIQEIMKSVMKAGEHYGIIPGCGDKPTLLQPGAEKLAFTFRLGPKYVIEETDLGEGHRTYKITASLYHIPTGNFIGEGVGMCATTETKYKYRTENTGKLVPKEYWDTRNKELLGGSQYSVRKVKTNENPKGTWYIFERMEHDNPSDYYNTCLKIGKKRALIDAIKTATAASDIFTQDLEDMVNEEERLELEKEKKSTPVEVVEVELPTGNNRNNKPALRVISAEQRKLMFAKLAEAGKSKEQLRDFIKNEFELDSTATLTQVQLDIILQWMEGKNV